MSTLDHALVVDLTGQAGLVTGAGRGLGRAFALALAKAGAKVAVTARTAAAVRETVEMVERDGGQAVGIPGDVSEPGAVTEIVKTAESKLGPLETSSITLASWGPSATTGT